MSISEEQKSEKPPLFGRKGTQSRGKQVGFTLLEVLVAFVVMSAVLVVIMQGFAGGLRNLGSADNYGLAALIAESRFNEVGLIHPVEEGEIEGVEEGTDFSWIIRFEPWDDTAMLAGESLQGLLLVTVEVAWPEFGKDKTFRLYSLRQEPVN